jgi:hypothetical protein
MTGTETNMIRNANARPSVMGKPRSTFLKVDSLVRARLRAARVNPSAIGTASASVIHTARMIQDGTARGIGTNAKASAAIFGAAMPTTSSGHTTAAPTSAERSV